jgi:molybdopterin-guanine dinucleotide biosynthesis adapter protein
MNENIPIICVVAARSKTGKTTLLEKLVREITGHGYKVGAVKSDAHGFDIDVPGKDTWRFAQAGARCVAISGPDKFALIQKTDQKKDLDGLAALMSDVDIILVEGFRSAGRPKIEVVRGERGQDIISPEGDLIALVTDIKDLKTSAPVYGLDDHQGLARLIMDAYLRRA